VVDKPAPQPRLPKSAAKEQKRAWLPILPGKLDLSRFSLSDLRSAKETYAFLSERIPGPEGLAYCVSGFRYLLLFGIASIREDKYPPLARCWRDLEKLFMNDPEFDDSAFVQSWILMDFAFGPEGQTALDYFEEFLKGTNEVRHLQPFIDEARTSRLGLYQDVMRTGKVATFRELFTGKVISASPSADEYGKGAILLTRTMNYGDQVFIVGNPKGFPEEAKTQLEDLVLSKLFYFDNEGETPFARYEAFMKLAGPYWMSCVTKNADTPFLAPNHYRTYLDDGL
jgi:hypothetical protein